MADTAAHSTMTGGAPAQRLHPASILVDFVARLGKILGFLAVALAFWIFGGDGGSSTVEIFAAAMGLFEVVGAIVTYMTLRYVVEADRITVSSGLIFKKRRVVPYERVQSVDLKRGFVERIFGIVTLSIDTAAGGEGEVRLSSIRPEQAERIRQTVYGTRVAAEQVDVDSETIWQATFSDLLKIGLTENRVAVILGAAAAALGALTPMAAALSFEWLRDLWDMLSLPVAIIGLVLLFCLGWVVSVVHAVVSKYGFRLYWEGGRLKRSYGLLDVTERDVATRRIQLLRIEAPLIRRALGWWTIFEESAGDQLGAVARPLCPILPKGQADGICRLIFPGLTVSDVEWQRMPSRARLKDVPENLALTVALAMGAWWWLGWNPVLVWLAGLAVFVVLTVAEHLTHAYSVNDDYLLIRGGLFRLKIWCIPRARIHGVTVSEPPVHRLLGLSKLVVEHSGAASVFPVRIDGLPLADAVPLQDSLSLAAHRAGPWTPDGL